MNVVEKAKEMQNPEHSGYIPELEVGEVCELNDLWDGDGEVPSGSYSFQITESDWINYQFEILEEKENSLDTIIRIQNIELI